MLFSYFMSFFKSLVTSFYLNTGERGRRETKKERGRMGKRGRGKKEKEGKQPPLNST